MTWRTQGVVGRPALSSALAAADAADDDEGGGVKPGGEEEEEAGVPGASAKGAASSWLP